MSASSKARKADLIRLLERFQAAEALLFEAASGHEERQARASLRVAGDDARALLITGRLPRDDNWNVGDPLYWETELAAERRAAALKAERDDLAAFDARQAAWRAARETLISETSFA